MNWDQIQGNWKQVMGKTKAQWGMLTDDDAEVAAGRDEQRAGESQACLGLAKEEADRQLLEWERQSTVAWFQKNQR